MKISVLVKPNSRKESVERLSDGALEVRVNAPPVEGQANEAVIEALARHFSVPKSAVSIVRGARGKKKVVEISG